MSISFSAADWLALLTHFLSLSLLAIGGAITTAPAMHNYLVVDKLWLPTASSPRPSRWPKPPQAPTFCSLPYWAGTWA